jgi:hypothetical protein
LRLSGDFRRAVTSGRFDKDRRVTVDLKEKPQYFGNFGGRNGAVKDPKDFQGI